MAGRDERIFPVASVYRPALRPTQPPAQWVPGVVSPGVMRGRGVTLITHTHLVPRSRMSRSYTSSSPRRLWRVAEQLLLLDILFNISSELPMPVVIGYLMIELFI
jgi:hypothetical protein